MKSMIHLSILLLLLHFHPLHGQTNPDTTQKIIPDRENVRSNYDKSYVILISIDGFRHDYMEKHKADNLLNYSKKGVRAEALIPSFPTFTFPNQDRKSTRLNSSHVAISYAVFCLKKK